jgi:hypothetical protein
MFSDVQASSVRVMAFCVQALRESV